MRATTPAPGMSGSPSRPLFRNSPRGSRCQPIHTSLRRWRRRRSQYATRKLPWRAPDWTACGGTFVLLSVRTVREEASGAAAPPRPRAPSKKFAMIVTTSALLGSVSLKPAVGSRLWSACWRVSSWLESPWLRSALWSAPPWTGSTSVSNSGTMTRNAAPLEPTRFVGLALTT